MVESVSFFHPYIAFERYKNRKWALAEEQHTWEAGPVKGSMLQSRLFSMLVAKIVSFSKQRMTLLTQSLSVSRFLLKG